MNLDGLDPHWVWLIAATVLAIAELAVPGVFLIWLAAAAAITGFLTLVFPVPLAFATCRPRKSSARRHRENWFSAKPVGKRLCVSIRTFCQRPARSRNYSSGTRTILIAKT